ncbi:MAG TPA: Hsp20/alpha crystallin family protein [Chthoniobacterales bacterium]|nr:Hsp20/alpha crystallin family protein [Chthoniobacterales bacterium]
MDPTRSIKLRWLHGTLGELTYQVTRLQLSSLAAPKWQPAINAFRCETAVRICVDLAGVDRSLIDLLVEPRRVVVRGTREAPEPTDAEGRAVQMLALEIDYGPFEREVRLPTEIDVDKVRAEQQNGLLWIYLPLKR